MSTCVLASTTRTTLLLALLLILCYSVCGTGLGAGLVCARAALTGRQRALCRAAPAALPALAAGLRRALDACRLAMQHQRWNCSGVGDDNIFAHIMPIASREAAFTYAITSAGATHALSAACARGDLPACGCSNRRRSMSHEQWEWGGAGARCGEAAYGARFARRFLDARELERDARALMNLHNNRVGRKSVKELVRRECKCHGVSGSCAVRTCWRALPPFPAVAAALAGKYRRAKQVVAQSRSSLDGRDVSQLQLKRASGRAPRKSELVYLTASPSYCDTTHGRRCDAATCAHLCCGRGHATLTRDVTAQCRCRFHWCCRVRCDTCTTVEHTHVCN